LTENSLCLPGSPAINFFLKNSFRASELDNLEVLEKFTLLDDTDIMSAIKQWQFADDKTLSLLCKMLTRRMLPKIELSLVPFTEDDIAKAKSSMIANNKNFEADINYFVQSGEVRNSGYDTQEEEIKILSKDGNVQNIYLISDMLSAKAFSQITKKYFLCTAKI